MSLLSANDQSGFLVQPPEWMESLRQSAIERVGTTPAIPTSKSERWKFTDLKSLKIEDSEMPSGTATEYSIFPDRPNFDFADYFAFDGVPFPVLPDGIQAGSIREIDSSRYLTRIAGEGDAIIDANTAGMTDGFVMIVPRGVHLAQPVEVGFSTANPPSPVHLRLLLVLEEGASATVVENHTGWGVGTLVTEIALGEGARLKHYRVNQTATNAIRLAAGTVKLSKDASYEAFSLITGGRLSRHEVTVELNGPGAEVHLNGAHVLSGQSHADTTTEIRHMAPHCASRETYRHVMDDSARSVFQGKIYVAEGAQKTDGFQLNQSLMLSATAEVNAKPELEIYADDVKCSHGATSGRLDEEALFYLRSRGIPEDDARAMLVEAFIGASIDLITDETVREAFRVRAARSLATREQGE